MFYTCSMQEDVSQSYSLRVLALRAVSQPIELPCNSRLHHIAVQCVRQAYISYDLISAVFKERIEQNPTFSSCPGLDSNVECWRCSNVPAKNAVAFFMTKTEISTLEAAYRQSQIYLLIFINEMLLTICWPLIIQYFFFNYICWDVTSSHDVQDMSEEFKCINYTSTCIPDAFKRPPVYQEKGCCYYRLLDGIHLKWATLLEIVRNGQA
jgi:hypothetical protein